MPLSDGFHKTHRAGGRDRTGISFFLNPRSMVSVRSIMRANFFSVEAARARLGCSGKNVYAANLHSAWGERARGVLAFERGEFDRAVRHFVAAAALTPTAPLAPKIKLAPVQPGRSLQRSIAP